MEPWAATKKKLLVSVAMPPAPVRVPSQRPLAPIIASVTSVAYEKHKRIEKQLFWAMEPRKILRWKIKLLNFAK